MHNQPIQPLSDLETLRNLPARLDEINQYSKADNDSEAQYYAMKLQEDLHYVGIRLVVLRVDVIGEPEYGIFTEH